MKRIISLCIVASFFLVGCTQTFTQQTSTLDVSQAHTATHDVVVIGGGVGGLTSALYTSLANLNTIVVEGPTPGGLITQSHSVRNWPGLFDVTGHELMDRLKDQVAKRGADVLDHQVTLVDFSSWPYLVKTKSTTGLSEPQELRAKSVIIALGAKNRYLGVPGEQKYWSSGVSNCATCDGGLYKDQDVVIVGGGDSAMVEASYLSRIAKTVTVLVRKEKLRATGQRVQEVKKLSNVTIRYNTQVKEIVGDDDEVTGVLVQDTKTRRTSRLNVDGIFLAIGFDPHTSLFNKQLKLDHRGYLITDSTQQTSVAGVFATGDITDPQFKQAITAAGDGCKAAMSAEKFVTQVNFQASQNEE